MKYVPGYVEFETRANAVEHFNQAFPNQTLILDTERNREYYEPPNHHPCTMVLVYFNPNTNAWAVHDW